MEITYSLERNDVVASSRYGLRRSMKRTRWIYRALYSLVVVSSFISCFSRHLRLVDNIVSFVFNVVIVIGGMFLFMALFKAFIIRRTIPKSKLSGVLCEHKIVMTETELHESTHVNNTSHSWRAVDQVDSDGTYIFILMSNAAIYTIPKRAFVDERHAQQFQEMAKYYLENASRQPAFPPVAPVQHQTISPAAPFDSDGMTPVERVFMQPESPRVEQRL